MKLSNTIEPYREAAVAHHMVHRQIPIHACPEEAITATVTAPGQVMHALLAFSRCYVSIKAAVLLEPVGAHLVLPAEMEALPLPAIALPQGPQHPALLPSVNQMTAETSAPEICNSWLLRQTPFSR